MKFAVLGLCIATLALGACRRESAVPEYVPMKLGGQSLTVAPAQDGGAQQR